MNRTFKNLLLAPLLLTLVACGTSSSDGPSDGDSTSLDILQRLNDEGSFTWVEDRFAQATDSGVESIYTVKDCSVWVFKSLDELTKADETGTFGFFNGEVWYGSDSYSSKGVALLTSSKDSPCAKVVFKSLNWKMESNDSDSSNNGIGLTGKWGSYSWMEDNVGMFLTVKEIDEKQYIGTFYSQGQSGGIFKDISVDITDIGDGMAEVTWPSGNTTIATWGKRDEKTSKDIDPNWRGDIWFDCLGEVDFAESRADCNFYWAGD